MPNRIFIIAGEASGDLHGSGLIRAIRKEAPDTRFFGIGGPKMASAGLQSLFHGSELAVVGIVEIFSHIRPIFRAYRRTIHWLRSERPDLLVLIDYPDFNFLVAREAKKLGIPVFYYITPQVWAWRQGRIKKLKQYTDRLGVILPFEEEFFRSRGLDASFVGHPLLDVVRVGVSRTEFCNSLGLDPETEMVGLLPGSRSGEVSRHLPLMVETALKLRDIRPRVQFIVPFAPAVAQRSRVLPKIMEKLGESVVIVRGRNYDAMAAADVLLTASGTVTLEAAILGTPMVVTYKVSPATYWLGKPFIKVPYVSLVNLVAGREVVPEILQKEATPRRLAGALLSILQNADRRKRMKRSLEEVSKALGEPGASERAAELALDLLASASAR